MDRRLVLLTLILLVLFTSMLVMSQSSTGFIPPSPAFSKIHTDNGTIKALNSSMPLNIKSGSGISVKSNNSTHTVTISNLVSSGTGSYNTTQANNVNINTGGSKINFINGTGSTINIKNSSVKNQVNVTISSSGGSGGITSINSQTGPAVSITGQTGNVTIASISNILTVGNGINNFIINGASQTISKFFTANLMSASSFIVDAGDNTKKIGFLLSGMISGKNLIIRANQTTSEGINIPNILETETFAIKPVILQVINLPNATGTTSITGVMMGMGNSCNITPKVTGRVFITVNGFASNIASNDGEFMLLAISSVGNQIAPLNGASPIGTQLSGKVSAVVDSTRTSITHEVPFSISGIQQGLTLNQSYWFDIEEGALFGGQAAIYDVSCSAFEL